MGLLDDAIREHLDLKRRRGADPAEVERLEREALGPVRRGFDQPLPGAPVAGEDDALDEHDFPEEPWQEPEPGEEHWEPAVGAPPVPGGDPRLGPAYAEEPPYAEDPELDDEDDDAPRGPVRPVRFQPRSLRDRFRRGPREESEGEPVGREFYEEDDFPEEEHPAPYRPPAGERDPLAYAGQETVEYDAVGDGPEFEERVRRIPRHPAAAPRDPASGGEPRSPAPPPPETPQEDVLEETPDFLHDTPEHDRLWFEQRPPRDFDFDG